VSGAIGFETDVSALNIKRRISHVSQKTNEIKPQILILIRPQQNIIVLKYFPFYREIREIRASYQNVILMKMFGLSGIGQRSF